MRVLLGAAAAASLLVAGACSGAGERSAPTTTVPKVLYVGDQPVKPEPAEVSQECAAYLADAREVIAAHDYFADLDLEGVHTILVATENRNISCTPEEMEGFVAEVAAWRAPIPPTYVEERYAELSSACAKVMEEPRARLRRVPTAIAGEELAAAIDEANTALEQCSPAERELFTEVEILPVQRRAGVLPAATDRDPVRVTEPEVVRPEGSAELSEGCADALAPARRLLERSVGKGVTGELVDEVSAAVAAAARGCSAEELDEFQRVEVAPALGLFHPGSATGS